MTLSELVAEASGRFDPAGRALHVFGLSYMAPGYHRMLAALARTREVRIYTLNPCREFWEDVETAGELRRRLRRSGGAFPRRAEARQPGLALDDDPLGLTSEGEMLALRLWGRPGRENVRLLNQLTDGDFEGRFAAADRRQGPPGTLLERLQRDVVDRVARSEPPALTSDGSVAVLRCPGLRRELEVVAGEIWRLVRADPGLELRDIAVVVPEGRKELYLPQVAAVFGEACELPHSVVDLPVGGRHRLGEAALMLLALPTGSFSRSELLPLLTHPSLMARFPEASPSHWLRLCDELGIVHGADHRDHAGTYIDRDLLNWDQGLRRLALGALMAGPRSGDETPVRLGEDHYLPADLPPDAARSALDFALLARSLLADARFAAGHPASDGEGPPARRPLPEWLELIRSLWSSYLIPADDEEQALLVRCLAVLDELEEVQIVGRDGVQAVPYEVAAELAERALGGLGGARGQYLARGVQVASFLPMRAIPFRVIFVLGLGHGMFPAAVRRPELDLRQARRAPGDVSPREQDLYLFLETLLSARERLVLSYVARDELTGEPLPPSSVLLELRELLAAYLPK
jgi:exodeoxyribonuclease V gamma subunit